MVSPQYLSSKVSKQKPVTPVFTAAAVPSTSTDRPASGTGQSIYNQTPVVLDSCEDMFREITKRLYGEEVIDQPESNQENDGQQQLNQILLNQQTPRNLGLMDLDYKQTGIGGQAQISRSPLVQMDSYSFPVNVNRPQIPGQGGMQPHNQIWTQNKYEFCNQQQTQVNGRALPLTIQTVDGPVLQLIMSGTQAHIISSLTPTMKRKRNNKFKKNADATVELAHITEPDAFATWIESEEPFSWNTVTRVAAYNSSQQLFRCLDCGTIDSLAQMAGHWIGVHSNLRVFQCPCCRYTSTWARCILMHLQSQHKEPNLPEYNWRRNPFLEEVIDYLLKLKHYVENKNELSSPSGSSVGGDDKQFKCPLCLYAANRRDTLTRHDMIHSGERPFQCFICYKEFYRADHCKKHFNSMHKEMVYDDLQKMRKASAYPLSF